MISRLSLFSLSPATQHLFGSLLGYLSPCTVTSGTCSSLYWIPLRTGAFDYISITDQADAEEVTYCLTTEDAFGNLFH